VEDILLGQLVGDILDQEQLDKDILVLEQLEEDILLGLLVEDTLQGQLEADKELYSEDILALEDKELGIGKEEAEFCHPL